MSAVSEYKAGKYDQEVKELALRLGGDVTCLIVCNGVKGSGFSVGIDAEAGYAGYPQALVILPAVLRDVANQIEAKLTGAARA